MSPLSLIRLSPRQHGWAWYLVPLNACSYGIALFVPLYLLQLGGTVVEIALAAFLAGLANTVGSFVWGRLIDTLNWRATAVMISALSTLAISLASYLAADISTVTALWTLLGFLIAGSGPSTNLLIMQRSKKEEWSDTFSWTSLITNVGIVIGMAAGFVWLALFDDIHSYAIVCSVIAGTTAVVVLPLFKKERLEIKQQRQNGENSKAIPNLIFNAVREVPLTFVTMGAAITDKIVSFMTHPSIRRDAYHSHTAKTTIGNKKQILFFAGVGVFFLSGNLFYTPYTPYLKANGITDSQVFLAYTVLTVSKVLFLPFIKRIVAAAGGEHRLAKLSYIPRIAGTAIAISAALLASGNANMIFMITLVAFVSVDVAFSMWSITTTSSLMKMVPSGKAGKIFGVNQAVTGLGLVTGSIVGGETAAAAGYPATFGLAIAVLIASLILIAASFRKEAPNLEAQIRR